MLLIITDKVFDDSGYTLSLDHPSVGTYIVLESCDICGGHDTAQFWIFAKALERTSSPW